MHRLYVFITLMVCCMTLSGCLSHWFLDSTSRLQVKNDTDDCVLHGLDVMASDSTYATWIDEEILPGERSRVVEEDWVGDFTLRLRYSKIADSLNVMEETRSFTLDGGSLYLVVKNDGDSLVLKFK